MITLSIVVPFYKKWEEFRRVFPYNARYIGRQDVELILAMDEPSQERHVVNMLAQFPLVQANIIVNDRAHSWRPPSCAINVGLRAAKGEFVLVVSPESAFIGDAPSRVVSVLRRRASTCMIGRVAWATIDEITKLPAEKLFERAAKARGGLRLDCYYGSTAASRQLFESVGGYDENLSKWGGDDDNLRVRMAMQGALLTLDYRLRMLHVSEEPRSTVNRKVPLHTDAEMRELCHPSSAVANPPGWGRDFGRVAAQWKAQSTALGARSNLSIGRTSRSASRKPRVVALFSFRYDAHLVPDLIENLQPIVDGWIAFDDRQSTSLFSNELYRRRVLLQQARAEGAEWVLAVDPDERFEATLAGHMENLISVERPVRWGFRLREMYSPEEYRVDGIWGDKVQYRLFPLRNDVRLGGGPLHSEWCVNYDQQLTGLNLYHLKMITPERRRARSALFTYLDPEHRYQEMGYGYLADDTGAVLERVAEGRGYRPRHRESGGLWMAEVEEGGLRGTVAGKLDSSITGKTR